MPLRRPAPTDSPARVVQRAAVLEAVLDQLPIAVAVWALPEGRRSARDLTLVERNRAANALATDQQRVGMTMEEMGGGLDRSDRAAALLAAITEGRTTHHEALPWTDPSGVTRLYAWTAVPLAGGAAAMATDVTGLVRTQEEARLYRAVVEAAPTAITVWKLEDPADPGSFRIEVANAEAARLTGLPRERLVGRRIDEISQDAVTTGRAALYAAIARGEAPVYSQRVRFQAPDGTARDLLAKVFRIDDTRVGMSVLELPLPGE